jgi:hypothetical protein
MLILCLQFGHFLLLNILLDPFAFMLSILLHPAYICFLLHCVISEACLKFYIFSEWGIYTSLIIKMMHLAILLLYSDHIPKALYVSIYLHPAE